MNKIKVKSQKNYLTHNNQFFGIQQVLVYRKFDYRDPRNTGIFLMVTINLEYRDFPRFSRKNSNTVIFPGKSRYSRLIRLISDQISGYFEKF